MKGVVIKFVNYDQPSTVKGSCIFVKGSGWDEVENKLSSLFPDNTYFNFMIIDSDFVRSYDAEISVHYENYSAEYQVDFEVVNTII